MGRFWPTDTVRTRVDNKPEMSLMLRSGRERANRSTSKVPPAGCMRSAVQLFLTAATHANGICCSAEGFFFLFFSIPAWFVYMMGLSIPMSLAQSGISIATNAPLPPAKFRSQTQRRERKGRPVTECAKKNKK